MPRIKRGGYIFVMWKGDHAPRHVHVYRDETLILRWDLESRKAMNGKAPRRIVEMIRQLRLEGLL